MSDFRWGQHEAAAARHGPTPRARIVAMASVGVAPRIMGVGPIAAARKLMRPGGIGVGDLGVIELNDAFASQAIATLRDLGIDRAPTDARTPCARLHAHRCRPGHRDAARARVAASVRAGRTIAASGNR